MEDGPKRLVGIALVESCGDICRQIYRETILCASPILKNGSAPFSVFLSRYRRTSRSRAHKSGDDRC
jgi:hypothetical protein